MNFLEADVAIKVDDSKLPAQLAKARSAVTRTVNKIKTYFRGMATSFKAAFDKMVRYAKYGAIAIVGALTFATRAAMKQEEAYAKLITVLKSTGYAAGLSAKQLIAHAKALQKVTVYGDETIEGMQALLLTFKSIRGEVFMRTTEAVLDLSKAMGQDLQQSVIQVGKAINDPILGITALRRVGIQFTAQQEELIRSLVKSGKLFEAQGIILTELESQFGGMSRIVDTGLGKWAQMRNAVGDVVEVIGNALLPGVKDSLTAIKEWAERNQERVGKWAKISVAYIAYVKDMLISFLQFLYTDWKAGLQFTADVGLKIWEVFAEKTKSVFRKLGDDLAHIITSEWSKSIWEWAMEKVIPPPAGIYTPPARPPGAQPKLIFKGYGEAEPTTIFSEPIVTQATKARKAIESIVPPDLQIKFDEAGNKLEAALAAVGTAAEEIEEPMREALVVPFEDATEAAEELVEKVVTRHKRVAEEYAMATANAWTDAFMRMATEGQKFGETMKQMFKELFAMMMRIYMYRKIAEPLAQKLFGIGAGAAIAIPGAMSGQAIAPSGTPYWPPGSLQHGGTVVETGLAVVHKGETYSGVGGGSLKVNISYEGQERPVVEEAEFDFRQQVLNITMQAAGTDSMYRRSHKIS